MYGSAPASLDQGKRNMLSDQHIGIIGVGHMGSSLIAGLLQGGFPAHHLHLCDHHSDKVLAWHQNHGVIVHERPTSMLHTPLDQLLIAVKPPHVQTVLQEIQRDLKQHPLTLISIAAGITTTQILHWLDQENYSVIRAMPNTPAQYRKGISALFATEHVSPTARQCATELLTAVGKVVWLKDEHQLNIVTALSGSGPAYFFYMMECLTDAAVNLGLPKDIANELTNNTAYGSAHMALASPDSLTTLRERVTSPGGTTESAIRTLKNGNMGALLQHALTSAMQRSIELSKLYD